MTGTFEQWTDRYRVFVDYVRALGQYKKDEAEAEISRAIAAGEREKVKALKKVVKQLDKDLKALRRTQENFKKYRNKITKQTNKARRLASGEKVNSLRPAWQGYKQLEREAMALNPEKLFAVTVTDNARPGNNFFSNHDDHHACEDLPTDNGNVLQMMQWLKDNTYLPKRGQPSQLCVVLLFKAMNEIATEVIDKMRDDMQKMQDKTYDAWKPVAVLGIEPDRTANSIINATV